MWYNSYFVKVIKLAPVNVSFHFKSLSWGRGACVLNGNATVGLGDHVHLTLECLAEHDYWNVHYFFSKQYLFSKLLLDTQNLNHTQSMAPWPTLQWLSQEAHAAFRPQKTRLKATQRHKNLCMSKHGCRHVRKMNASPPSAMMVLWD